MNTRTDSPTESNVMPWTHLVGFGEAMVRLTSPVGIPLPAAHRVDVTVGGAELNALVAARLVGMPATWVTALPSGAVADLVSRQVAASRVDIRMAASTGTRVGLYFLESNAAPRPSRITYDRAGSAFALLDPDSLQWDRLLGEDSCLLVSGITPAVGDGPRRAMREAIGAARRAGATVAFDVNYRPSLWTAEECFDLVSDVVHDVDVLCASPSDLRALGIDDDDPWTAAVRAFGLRAIVGTSKAYMGSTVEITLTAADERDRVQRSVGTSVVDAVGAGDAMFGTFLATMQADGLAVAADRALGAAVTAYGTAGDLLVAVPWNVDGPTGGVQR